MATNASGFVANTERDSAKRLGYRFFMLSEWLREALDLSGVKQADGRMFVKVLRRGSTDKTWTLQSFNTLYADMKDEVVEWVAKIEWTRQR